ncbi:protein kinase [Streptomyces sannanensis]|uniref:protein kinase n=1 Tax=Streptomyces sannanensis TaxID=285536 RepID=UPI0031E59F83
MDDYAGRVLADRYRLPMPPSDEYELVETRAFDTYSGQEVLLRQVPLPETVDAELLDADGAATASGGITPPQNLRSGRPPAPLRSPADPAVRRAVEAAEAAARIPDHPRLDQVFDVFAEGGSLWIVSELVEARPLAALLAERPLTPYRAAEVASDVLAALRVLHAHGWTHRNITVRTVLVCDDGRVVLTGLAAGAAEEALCGYAPVPADRTPAPPGPPAGQGTVPALPDGGPYTTAEPGARAVAGGAAGDSRAARAEAIAAYTAGARAAARAGEDGHSAAGAVVPRSGSAPWGGGAAADGAAPASQPLQTGLREAPEAPYAGPASRPYPASASAPGTPGAPGRASGTPGMAPMPPPAGAPQVPAARRPLLDTADGLARTGHATTVEAAAGTPAPASGTDGWGEPTAGFHGPTTPLAAERARQARIAAVGAVTERWAPEQAGPVQGNWQLAAPVGPATDLWALGAVLFRVVQGHAPYPEESAAELVQLVCAEPPAFAEDCGPLRPVVESLLRQDPTERPDFEELSGWLRSIVRSAPEPDAGSRVVPLPAPERDAARLPVVRRRGELVRRRRTPSSVAAPAHGRHRQAQQRKPRAFGRTLLLLVLLGLAGAVAYAVLFMPKAGEGEKRPDPATSGAPATASPKARPAQSPVAQPSRSGDPAKTGDLARGYELRKDPEGFEIAIDKDWSRRPVNDAGQVRYLGGDFELVVVPGRDTVKANGPDPMVYQRDKERELQPFRDSTWSTATGLRRIDVGQRAMAEGQFTWQDSSGREVYVRNLAMIVDGRYHVVQVIGPEAQRDRVTEIYEQTSATYRVNS